MKKILPKITAVVIAALYIWVTASFVEVITHNRNPWDEHYEYSKGNVFSIFLEVLQEC